MQKKVIDINDGVVCFTGHRNIPLGELESITQKLADEVLRLIQDGYRKFAVGGALGFDTLAAKTVLMYKRNLSEIELLLVLPCRSQSKYWDDEDRKIYQEIIQQADSVEYMSEQYYRGCMFARNRRLIDMSELCICYLTSDLGGTAYTVKYATKKSIAIVNIAKK